MLVVVQPKEEEAPITIKKDAKANIRKKILGLARHMRDTGVDPLQGFVSVPEEVGQDSKEDAKLPLSLELSPTLDEGGDQAPADEVPKKILAKLDK